MSVRRRNYLRDIGYVFWDAKWFEGMELQDIEYDYENSGLFEDNIKDVFLPRHLISDLEKK